MKIIGVIGLGSIGMRHAKNLREMGHHVWGYDTDMSKRLELGYDYTASKIEDLASADAWVIASPTREHISDFVTATRYGRPVFMEKPIGNAYLSTLSAVLMVGYNQRFNAAVKHAKKLLEDGMIGDPLWGIFSCSQFNDKPAYLRDGIILNWSHEIDLALYLLGPAKITASSTRITRGIPDPMTKIAFENDDMTDILLRHEDGCMTTIHLDYLTKPERRGFAIGGTKGWLSANLPERRTNLYTETGYNQSFHDDEGSYDQDYKDEMSAFIDRIDGKETIGCTGEEGLEVLKICLEVRQQAGLSWDVSW